MRTAAVAVMALCHVAVAFADSKYEGDETLPCQRVVSRKQLCACVRKDERYGDECEIVTGSETPHGLLLRAGSGQGHDVYAALAVGSGWKVADRIFYEQGHGKRSTSINLDHSNELQVGSVLVVRFDYTITEDTVYDEEGEETATTTETALCVPARDCVTIATSCKAENETTKKRDSFSGTLRIADNGTVAVEVTSHGSGVMCPSPKPVNISAATTGVDTRFGHATTCTVAQNKAHFYSDNGEQQGAYVQRGDSVDVSEVPAAGQLASQFVLARFVGSKKTTVGLLKKDEVSCPKAKP